MTLTALVYVSCATNKMMPEHELKDLLIKARDKNQQKDITSMLLYRNGFFVQALEGEKRNVENTFEIIRQDPRHHNLIVLYNFKIYKRSFEDWSMGFSVIDDEAIKSIDGFNDFLNKPFSIDYFKHNPSHVMTLLNRFSPVC